METEETELERLLQLASDEGLLEGFSVEDEVVTLHVQGITMALRSEYAEVILRRMLGAGPPPPSAWKA